MHRYRNIVKCQHIQFKQSNSRATKSNMLSLSKHLVQIDIVDESRVIALTESRILFTHLPEMDEACLSMPVIGGNPRRFHYAPAALQVLVHTDTTLEVFHCDWKTQIKLVRIVILDHHDIDMIYFGGGSGWNVHGSSLEYEPAKVSFHQPVPKPEQGSRILAECAVGPNKYMLTPQSLVKSEAGKSLEEIAWKDRLKTLTTLNFAVEMKGMANGDKMVDVLCISNSQAIIVSKNQVISTVKQPNICLLANNLLFSALQETQQYINVQLLHDNAFQHALTMESPLGLIRAASIDLFTSKLNILTSARNQVSLQVVDLPSSSHPSTQGKFRGSSQRANAQEEANGWEKRTPKGRNSQQRDKAGPQEPRSSKECKPIIRDIMLSEEDEVNSQSMRNSSSEVLSKSALQDRNGFEEFPMGVEQTSSREMDESLSDIRGGGIQIDSVLNKSDSSQSCLEYPNDQNWRSRPIDSSIETPMFVDNTLLGSNFLNSDNKWINLRSERIIEDHYQQEEAEDLLEFDAKVSKKVEFFLQGKPVSKQEIMRIESTSYCRLIEGLVEKEGGKLQVLVSEFLLDIIEEAEAPLFFADHIRTLSAELTGEKIRMFFQHILDKEEYKECMTNAVQHFKVSEVPEDMLRFSKDFIKVVKVLCRDIYIEDLISPTSETIRYLLESYFSLPGFEQEVVTIEDEHIDITHPRNLLNILLYLNEEFNLSLPDIIQVYCSKLLLHNHLDTIEKLLEEKMDHKDIFQVCGVSRSLLDDALIARIIELLHQSVENATYLWQLVPFLSETLIDDYRIRLAVIAELNSCNIMFNVDSILNLTCSLFSFFEDIISNNSCLNLLNFKFDSVYLSIFWIQEREKLSFMTNQYIKVIKILAEKYMAHQEPYHAFRLLQGIAAELRPSFIAKLLFLYLDGKLLNRLTELHEPITNLYNLFPQLLKERKPILRDKEQFPTTSKLFTCCWGEFLAIFVRYFKGPHQLHFLTFSCPNLAYQMFFSLPEAQKRKFATFLEEIAPYLPQGLQDTVNELDESINPRAETRIRFEERVHSYTQSQATSQTHHEELLLESQSIHTQKEKVYKSMAIIDHYMEVSEKRKIHRANSDCLQSSVKEEHSELRRLKLLVHKEEMVECLREIYEYSCTEVFVRASCLVGERIRLHHIDGLKQICGKGIKFQIQRILPFQVFLIEGDQEAFKISGERVRNELNVQNFWVVFMLIEFMFGQGTGVCEILLDNIITYHRSDELADVIAHIFTTLRPNINTHSLLVLKNSACEYSLTRTETQLRQYMQTIN